MPQNLIPFFNWDLKYHIKVKQKENEIDTIYNSPFGPVSVRMTDTIIKLSNKFLLKLNDKGDKYWEYVH